MEIEGLTLDASDLKYYNILDTFDAWPLQLLPNKYQKLLLDFIILVEVILYNVFRVHLDLVSGKRMITLLNNSKSIYQIVYLYAVLHTQVKTSLYLNRCGAHGGHVCILKHLKFEYLSGNITRI